MPYNNDLFSDIDNVAQPESLNDDKPSTHTEETFFKHFSNNESPYFNNKNMRSVYE